MEAKKRRWIILLVTLLYLLGTAGSAAAQPARLAKNMWWVMLNSNVKSLCRGQQTMIQGEYGYTGKYGGKGPISGPMYINAIAEDGTVAPAVIRVNGTSGSFSFTYTAPDKATLDRVEASVPVGGTDVTPVYISVTDSCEYDLMLSGDLWASGEGLETLYYKLGADFTIKPLESNSKKFAGESQVGFEIEITQYSAELCTLISKQVGHADANLRAEAETIADGSLLDVKLYRTDFPGQVTASITCNNPDNGEQQSFSQSANLPKANGAGAWIQQVFLADGGCLKVKNDILDRIATTFQSHGLSVDYIGTYLDVERRFEE